MVNELHAACKAKHIADHVIHNARLTTDSGVGAGLLAQTECNAAIRCAVWANRLVGKLFARLLEHVKHVRRGQLGQALETHIAQTCTHHTHQLLEPAASFFTEGFGNPCFFGVRNDLAQGLQLLDFFAATKGGIGSDGVQYFRHQRFAAELLSQRNHVSLLGKSVQALGTNYGVDAIVTDQLVGDGLFQVFDVGVLVANHKHRTVREHSTAHKAVYSVDAVCGHLIEQLDGYLPRCGGVDELDVVRQLQAVNDFLRFGSIDHGV